MRRREAGQGAAPAGRVSQARPPGGQGSPSVPTTRVCLQWLDEDRTNGGETCRDQGRQTAPVRARKHGPEAEEVAAVERRKAQ